MILADSSVWIDHFRQANPLIPELLEQELIVMHPYVVGEICLGSLADRHEVLEWLDGLPAAR